MAGKIDLTDKKLYIVEDSKYDRVANGQHLNLTVYMGATAKKKKAK